MKGFSIALLIITFFAFLFYQTQKSSDFLVLKVNSPTQIVVDLNNNGLDDDEPIELEDIQSFSTKPDQEQLELAKNLKISQEDSIGLGFLAQNFAKETLENKNVKIKDSQIFVDGKNYETLIIDRGFALKDKAPTKQFTQQLEKVRKFHLIIFNNKSHKYHKLTCKYGLLAHNSQIIPANQLPKDAKACKFCLLKKEKGKRGKEKAFFKHGYYDEIPFVKSPATIFKTDNIKIFLTDFTKVLKPSNTCDTQVCKALVDEINAAQNSIDFAIYGYTKVPALQKALESAQTRGVKIRFVYDLDKNNTNIYPDTSYLSKILTSNNHDTDNKLMHDKFFVFDNKKVMTGSANISNTDMSGFNSNAIILIYSEKIANIYSQEFEQMYSGKFHKQKSKICDKQENNISVYFSPQDKAITTQVIPLVDSAQKYVYIPAFLITHKGLSDSLINASKRGVAVKIILDSTNTHTPSSKMKMLRAAGIQVKTENLAGKLHSKSIIIDDSCTIIGSMNFSRSGEGVNDENLIVIKDPQIAQFYKTFFQYLWQRIPDFWLTHNARSESPDSIGSCKDGIDNDFDGKIDKTDDGCNLNRL